MPDTTHVTLDKLVRIERHFRLYDRDKGCAYHHWRARGDREPPAQEHWCDFCAGWFGVPHDTIHSNVVTGRPQSCRFLHRALNGERQCACIECVVAETWRRCG